MKPEFKKAKTARKGGKDVVMGSLALYLGGLVTAATGVPVIVVAPLIGGGLSMTRNVLKQKLPRFFGWL